MHEIHVTKQITEKLIHVFCYFLQQNINHLGSAAAFLSRVSTLTRDINVAILFVRPSVCPVRRVPVS